MPLSAANSSTRSPLADAEPYASKKADRAMRRSELDLRPRSGQQMPTNDNNNNSNNNNNNYIHYVHTARTCNNTAGHSGNQQLVPETTAVCVLTADHGYPSTALIGCQGEELVIGDASLALFTNGLHILLHGCEIASSSILRWAIQRVQEIHLMDLIRSRSETRVSH